MKIVLGTANFNQKYGIYNSKIKNIKEIKEILTFLKKNKVLYIDTAFLINYQKTLLLNLILIILKL